VAEPCGGDDCSRDAVHPSGSYRRHIGLTATTDQRLWRSGSQSGGEEPSTLWMPQGPARQFRLANKALAGSRLEPVGVGPRNERGAPGQAAGRLRDRGNHAAACPWCRHQNCEAQGRCGGASRGRSQEIR